jgi:tRNA A-37 threonylcarbamoyl transferase component Bud32
MSINVKIPSKIYPSGFLPNPEDYYIKHNVSINEYKMHKYVYNLNIVNVPKIFNYDKKMKIMTLHKIMGMNLSDLYGENIKDVPKEKIKGVREIIKILTEYNIEYPDITGYNFMLDGREKLWIIDFEHSKYNLNITDDYILSFCDGTNSSWNPDFT